MVSPLDDELPRPRNTWAAYVRGLAGDVRQLEAGLGAGQAPPRASDEEVTSAMGGRASSGEVHDGETGVRTPASDELPKVSKPGRSSESQSTTSVPTAAELRYKVQFTVDQAYVALLEEARNLLQHELPSRDLVAVQRRALELLVKKLRQRKYAASERPHPKAPGPANGTSQSQPKSTPARPPAPPATGAPHSTSQPASQSRYIPAEVRRSVWRRDEARCAYVDTRGQRCREQSGLEFHHQHPHGRGGPPSFDNIALRCRSHNDLAAEQDFGRDVIREKKRARRAAGAEASRAGAAP
jgi:5-methylcytosine-specific restriction endonuclease McrA